MKIWQIGLGVVAMVFMLAFAAGEARSDGIALGVILKDTPKGVEVTDVIPYGIADRCMPRLKPGAHIITLNGAPLQSAEDFKRILDSSNFVKFQFVDPTGELRWANAWSGGQPGRNCRP